MKFISTTLTGNNEDTIAEALQSVVDWVDVCLVVDTGVTDKSLEIAKNIAGDKLVVQRFEWVNDFSQARNFSLQAAHALGGDWAITVDTDERIFLNGEDLRATARATTKGVLLMPDKDKNYTKERLIKLPTAARFTGPTHEAFVARDVGSEVTRGSYFFELPKDREKLRKKFQRDAEILSSYVRKHPNDPRWYYYLGESLKNLGKFRDAIPAYRRCTDLRGWDEESAWACFRAAQCHDELADYAPMVDVLTLGMARHAGIAELMWYAGYACGRTGRQHQAVYWANLAITWGLYKGKGERVPRIGFRYMPGLFEGPFDVLRFALKAVGDKRGAAEAELEYARAKVARQKYRQR